MPERIIAVRKLLHTYRVTLALVGLLAIFAGVAILVIPDRTARLMMGALIAAYLIIAGLVYLGAGIFAKERDGWARAGHLVLGLLNIVAGGLLFVNLDAGTTGLAIFLSVVVGISWILDGIVALTLMGVALSKVWTLAYAFMSILGGAALVLWPLYGASILGGAALLWMFFGISLIVLGVSQFMRSVTLGRLDRETEDAVQAALERQRSA